MSQQILLIDDSKPIHPLVSALLGDEPVTIHSAFDANYGVVLAASLQPDLILLDVDMPGIDGFEACRRLKADTVTAHIPIIFMTARAATEEMVKGLELGANDYVAKPFKLSELLSRVRASLRTSHLIRMLEHNALVDPLTGIGNRAMFDQRLAAEVSLRIRSKVPLSCILLEIDQYDQVHEQHGHVFAEHVLHKVGETLLEICRDEDVPCRMAGQQFSILTPQTSTAEAIDLAEAVRGAVEKISFAPKYPGVKITCSLGIAEAEGLYDRGILDRAEDALHQSKDEGHNRVSHAFVRASMPLARAA